MKNKFFLFCSLFAIAITFSCQSSQNSTETESSTAVSDAPIDKEKQVSIVKKLPPKQFKDQLTATNDALLIDVRTPAEYSAGHIENSINIDFRNENFSSQIEEVIDLKRPVFVYCRSGGRSFSASEVLKKLGCHEIYDLAGGYMAWMKTASVSLPDDQKESKQ